MWIQLRLCSVRMLYIWARKLHVWNSVTLDPCTLVYSIRTSRTNTPCQGLRGSLTSNQLDSQTLSNSQLSAAVDRINRHLVDQNRFGLDRIWFAWPNLIHLVVVFVAIQSETWSANVLPIIYYRMIDFSKKIHEHQTSPTVTFRLASSLLDQWCIKGFKRFFSSAKMIVLIETQFEAWL